MTCMPNSSDSLKEICLRLPGERPMRYLCESSAMPDRSPCIVLSRFNESPQRYVIKRAEAIIFDAQDRTCDTHVKTYEKATTAYCEALHRLIEELQLTGGKTVVSRILTAYTKLSSLEIFRRLCLAYPSAAVGLWTSGEDTWLVATPELLLTADADMLQTMSLAGTRPVSSEPAEWDAKNLREQQMVTDYIMETLKSLNLIPVAEEPSTLKAGPVEHICTRISAARCGADPLDVASLLAPTPAVAGLPKDLSLRRIADIEPHAREFYAGFFGISDTATSNFFVTLRCMRLNPSGTVSIYVGSGITADSLPEAEWEETCNKAGTLLAILH